jgi:hypothetical protein
VCVKSDAATSGYSAHDSTMLPQKKGATRILWA